jgi:short-subunit dehydrogenase
LGKPKVDANSAKQGKMALPAPRAAEIIIKAMENNKYRATVGKDATMLDILYRLSPRFATNFIGKMMKKALRNM